MIPTLLLLGATGDLARRFLYPALVALEKAERLPDGFRVIGGARTPLDDGGFRRLTRDALPAKMLTYRCVDLAEPSQLAGALGDAADPVAVYLALPPDLFEPTIEALAALDLAAGSRVIVEKPFGNDAESAAALNVSLARTGCDAYRVDHVLAMETTQNFVAMRHHNPVLERIWNGESVEQVDILWDETLALEGRTDFYDETGALKDVLQSHLLQLLTLIATEMPAGANDAHVRKLNVLRSVRAPVWSRRARYTAGTLADGRRVRAYAEEDGVDPERCTETFAEVALELDLPRWAGTRFVLRAGKALARRRKLFRLRFRPEGVLEFGIDGPVDVVLHVRGLASNPIVLRARPPGDAIPPYGHVLLDVLGGTTEFSVGGDEAVESWRIVTPVLHAWEAGKVPLDSYAAGSAGPA